MELVNLAAAASRPYVELPLPLLDGLRIPLIAIMLFTMPEEGTANSMTWRWTVGQLPLTV